MTKKVDKTHDEMVDVVFDLVKADKTTYSVVEKGKQVKELKKET